MTKHGIEVPSFRDDPEACIDACGILDGMDAAQCQQVCSANQDAWKAGKLMAADYGLTGQLAQIYALAYLHGWRHEQMTKGE